MNDFIEPDAGGSDALVRITRLADLLREQEREVARLELLLRDAKEAAQRTETEDLPDLMIELNLTEIKLLDGTKVEVRKEVQCGISEERRPAAHRWLQDHGFGGLIKTELIVGFGRDERDKAVAAAGQVAALLDRDVGFDEKVHPATLKSFIKEQMELGPEGSNPPAELFAIYPFNKAKLTAPRAAAPKRSKAS